MIPKSIDPRAEAASEPSDATEDPLSLIAALVRGEPRVLEILVNRASRDAFLRTVETHSLGPLLHHVLSSSGARGEYPEEIREALADTARKEAQREETRVEETRRVLAALDAERIIPLVLNGAALAYSLYPRPHLRVRKETDLLVRQAAVADVVRILRELGYRRHDPMPGERVLRRDTYLRQDDSGFEHVLNLHWAISNRPALADSFDYTEIRQRAVAIEALSPCAMGLCHEDALLHACLNRSTRGEDESLLSLYDVHLLVGSMTAIEFERFAHAALDKRLGRAARDSIAEAQRRFHTDLPSGEMDDHFYPEKLAEESRLGRAATGWQWLNTLIYDVRILGQLREKMALLVANHRRRPAYNSDQYDSSPPSWQPTIFVRRAVKSVAGLLKRSS